MLIVVDDAVKEGTERFNFKFGTLPQGVRVDGYHVAIFNVDLSDGADRGGMLF